MAEHSTVADVIDLALQSYAALTELGEEVEDEWSYVTDLSEAWRVRLDEVTAARGDSPADPAIVTAIAALADEAARISDPHRVIDWLSTFPQVVLVALGEPS